MQTELLRADLVEDSIEEMEAAAIVEGTDSIGEADASMEPEDEETKVRYVSMVKMLL
jgi:hypothetical protein